jgi:hypothetical protein
MLEVLQQEIENVSFTVNEKVVENLGFALSHQSLKNLVEISTEDGFLGILFKEFK